MVITAIGFWRSVPAAIPVAAQMLLRSELVSVLQVISAAGRSPVDLSSCRGSALLAGRRTYIAIPGIRPLDNITNHGPDNGMRRPADPSRCALSRRAVASFRSSSLLLP